jgi:DASH complex subunit DAD3
VTTLSANLSSSEKHAGLLNDLRVLERKMGLVLTLFKASVWSLIQTHQDEMEEEEQRKQQQDDSQYSSYPSEAADETVTNQGYHY